MQVEFSKISVIKLELIHEYLLDEWDMRSANKFISLLNSKIEAIKKNPNRFPPSTFDNSLRRCDITRRNYFLYEIESQTIFVVNLIDSRQNPLTIKEQVQKQK